ncbi:copper chaperone PCu(A)C [Rhizobium sp. A22-96]
MHLHCQTSAWHLRYSSVITAPLLLFSPGKMIKHLFLVFAAAFAITPLAADAQNATGGQITIPHAWSHATPPGFQPKTSEWDLDLLGEAYLTIVNAGTDDRLIAAAVDPAIADSVALNRVKVDRGVMQIDAIDGGLVVPAGQTLELSREGIHVVLTGLKAPLRDGEHVPLKLIFQKAGTLTVDLAVTASDTVAP